MVDRDWKHHKPETPVPALAVRLGWGVTDIFGVILLSPLFVPLPQSLRENPATG